MMKLKSTDFLAPSPNAVKDFKLHAVRNEAVNPRSRAPALERTALEAPAFSANHGRQEPPEQRVPRLEPRNKDINSDHVKFNRRQFSDFSQSQAQRLQIAS